jgi:hypothetical protein
VPAAIEITQIVSMPGGIDQRAEALLEPLHQVVPFEGAWLSLLDPERREQPPLVSRGYPAELIRYMSGPAGVAEIELLGLNRNSGATRVADLSVPVDECGPGRSTWHRRASVAGWGPDCSPQTAATSGCSA